MKALYEKAVNILKSVKSVDDFIELVGTKNYFGEAKIDVDGYSLAVNELLSNVPNIKKFSAEKGDCYFFADKTSCINIGGDLLRSIGVIGDNEHRSMFQII